MSSEALEQRYHPLAPVGVEADSGNETALANRASRLVVRRLLGEDSAAVSLR